MQMIYNTSLAIFNEAVDYFFSWSPKNPYWFLMVMYLRKEGSLAIVNDYAGDKCNIIAPIADKTHWDTVNAREKWPDGVTTISIVGNMSTNIKLTEINEVFQRSAEKQDNNKRRANNVFIRNQWEPTFLLEVARLIISVDDEWFENNYTILFDRVIQRIFAKDRSTSFSLPLELNEIVSALIGSDTRKVYNPYAGTANLVLSLPDSHLEYLGEEQDELNAAIGNLRILSSKLNGSVQVHNSVHTLSFDADLILSSVPYEGQTAQNYQASLMSLLPDDRRQLEDIYGTRNDAITLVVRKCVVTGCRGIIIAPDVVNFRMGRYDDLRRYLVQSDCVDMIISMTSTGFSYTSIPLAIYVINNNHSHKGSIRFVNICEVEKDSDLFLRSLSNNLPFDDNISKLIPLHEIVENNFILAPEAYVFPLIDLSEKDVMRNILEVGSLVSYRRFNVKKGLYLHGNFFNQENKTRVIHANDLEIEDIDGRQVLRISKPCIMISPVGSKTVCIDPQGKNIYVDYRGQIFFEPNTDIVLPQYLALQFNAEYVKKQFGDRPVQTAASVFARTIFNRIKVLVPPLDEQQKIVDEYQLNLIGELGMEVDSLKSKHFNEYERNMHLRKHALKQVMNEVLPAARRIAHFITNQEGDFSKKSIIAERSQSTLESYVVKLFNNVEKVNSLISALTEETRFNAPEMIEIDTFIARYQHSKLAENYDINYFGHNDLLDDVTPDISNVPLIGVTDKGNPVFVLPEPITAYIAPDCLTTVLDNIIANAVKHGFTNPERKDYAVRIEFRNTNIEGRDMVEFIVANNGEKVPVGMSADRMFTWGVGSGTGLGSWQTKNIIEHFGGSIEFIQYDDKADGFNIEYRFTIPMREE